MPNLEVKDRAEWIRQAREQQAIAQQLERSLVDPQAQVVRVQVARALADG
jgi:hypothetical protein